jgi:hypothetical protein
MLKVASAIIAYFGITSSPLEAVSLMPLKTAATELVILGAVPLTTLELTFHEVFFVALAIPMFFIYRGLFRIGRQILTQFMWNAEYLDQISI